MKVTVTFRHMDATDALKTHVSEKLEKIKKYLIKPIDAHVILSVEKFRHQCEVTVIASHFNGTALEISEDLYNSIDQAVHKIERQLRKHKEKLKDHKHQQSLHESSADAERDYEKLVEESSSS